MTLKGTVRAIYDGPGVHMLQLGVVRSRSLQRRSGAGRLGMHVEPDRLRLTNPGCHLLQGLMFSVTIEHILVVNKDMNET
jgi:hypothetical protein